MNKGAGCTNLRVLVISFLGGVDSCTLRHCSFGGGGCSQEVHELFVNIVLTRGALE